MLPVVVLKAEVAGRGPEGYVGGTAGDWGCWLLWTGLEPFLAGDWLTSLSVERPLFLSSSEFSVVQLAGLGGMGELDVVEVGVLLD